MKKLEILFFGKLKEVWNTNSITLESNSQNIESLYSELLETASEEPNKASIKVAINDEFVEWETTINDGDTIAFLPPASGG